LIYTIGAPVELPSKRYKSAFRAPTNKSAFSSAAALTFDSHTFKRTFCTVDQHGEITLITKADPETILVVRGWTKFIGSGTPLGGYLSNGYFKYAFRVSFSSKLTRSHSNSSIILLGFVGPSSLRHIPESILWHDEFY
jgi:hypothetical protein